MIHNVRAVTLWSRRSREADKVVGLFTDRLGRITARATSAARAVAKFASLTEPFVESEIALYLNPAHGWGKIVGGRIIRSFPGLRGNLPRSTAASWVCEVVHRLTPEEQSSPDKFSLLTDTLEAIENAPRFGVIRLAFTVRFLNLVGLGVENRDAWIEFATAHPEWARELHVAGLRDLGDCVWESPELTLLEGLAGSLVHDHLNRPLHVNRFRQMTGVEI